MPDRPLILTGFMGSGKSSVGRVLSRLIGCPFVDLDRVIAAEAGRSINEIFAQEGEAGFRERESRCLERVLTGGMTVISGGGGVVVSGANRRLMRSEAFVVNLTASLSVIMGRLDGAADRPLYAGKDAAERVRKLMEERESFYADADIRIDTDNKSVEDVSVEILNVLKGLQA